MEFSITMEFTGSASSPRVSLSTKVHGLSVTRICSVSFTKDCHQLRGCPRPRIVGGNHRDAFQAVLFVEILDSPRNVIDR
jgi:hypothetical protein